MDLVPLDEGDNTQIVEPLNLNGSNPIPLNRFVGEYGEGLNPQLDREEVTVSDLPSEMGISLSLKGTSYGDLFIRVTPEVESDKIEILTPGDIRKALDQVATGDALVIDVSKIFREAKGETTVSTEKRANVLDPNQPMRINSNMVNPTNPYDSASHTHQFIVRRSSHAEGLGGTELAEGGVYAIFIEMERLQQGRKLSNGQTIENPMNAHLIKSIRCQRVNTDGINSFINTQLEIQLHIEKENRVILEGASQESAINEAIDNTLLLLKSNKYKRYSKKEMQDIFNRWKEDDKLNSRAIISMPFGNFARDINDYDLDSNNRDQIRDRLAVAAGINKYSIVQALENGKALGSPIPQILPFSQDTYSNTRKYEKITDEQVVVAIVENRLRGKNVVMKGDTMLVTDPQNPALLYEVYKVGFGSSEQVFIHSKVINTEAIQNALRTIDERFEEKRFSAGMRSFATEWSPKDLGLVLNDEQEWVLNNDNTGFYINGSKNTTSNLESDTLILGQGINISLVFKVRGIRYAIEEANLQNFLTNISELLTNEEVEKIKTKITQSAGMIQATRSILDLESTLVEKDTALEERSAALRSLGEQHRNLEVTTSAQKTQIEEKDKLLREKQIRIDRDSISLENLKNTLETKENENKELRLRVQELVSTIKNFVLEKNPFKRRNHKKRLEELVE